MLQSQTNKQTGATTLKIKSLSKDRSPQLFEIDGIEFMVKPSDQNMKFSFKTRSMANTADLFSKETKRYFGKTHITGWENLIDEETGKAIEFDPDTAANLMVDESLDDLFFELFNFSYGLSHKADQNQEKAADDAAKK